MKHERGPSQRSIRRSVRGLAVVCVALVVATVSVPVAAYQRPGRTERVSVATDGALGSGVNARISADGRVVAFASSASNLVPDDTNGEFDVFARDRETRTTQRMSVAGDGAEGNNFSGNPAISGDGRHVAFSSSASNLVPGDSNGTWDIFVHGRDTLTTQRLSVASDGSEANASSVLPSLSADGRFVGFQSTASNLVPGDTNGTNDIFVHDRDTGTTERVSVASDGMEGNAGSLNPSLSADGRLVSFHGDASNLVPDDTNGTRDVFVHDRETGVTERVSKSSDGTEGNGISTVSSISADGRHVAFYSFALNLVPNDTNATNDVFVHDRKTGITERVSVTSEGRQGDSSSFWPDISPDGRYVTFESFATNLVPDDDNRARDIFVHDRETRTTERASVASDGSQSDGSSAVPVLSMGGSHVAFNSFATNLEPGGASGGSKIYVRERGPAVGVGDLAVSANGDEVIISGWASFSGVTISSVDELPEGSPGADHTGADLTAARVVFRPEPEDVLVRLGLASLPDPPASGGAPSILYGLRFELGGERYEIRATGVAATAVPPTAPWFALYRCDPDCVEQESLLGAIGTTETEVLISIPLAALEFSEEELENLQAFTAVGEPDQGALVILDEADLPDATVPGPQVSLAIAPAGTPEEEIGFDVASDVTEGNFSGSLDISSLPDDDYEVWARACLGETCGAKSEPFVIEGTPIERIETVLDLTVEGRGQSTILRARLTELESSSAIAGRTIDFYSDSELIASHQTDEDGIAEVAVPPGHRGANRTYEAIFEGDDLYGPSSNSRPGRVGGDGEGATATQTGSLYRIRVLPL